MQQLTGASAGYLVGLVPHEDAVNLGWMMLGFALTGAVAQFFLRRR
jgi:DHA1 family bicyclomycin/chloramphenicol resistance-like MFS transporter